MSDMNEPGEPPGAVTPVPAAEPRAPAAEPVDPPTAPASWARAEPERRSAVPVLTALGMLVLLVGLVWVWRQDVGVQQRLEAVEAAARGAPSVDPAQIAALQSGQDALRKELASLAARPAPKPVDLGPIEQRLTAIEQRPTPKPADLGPIEQRLSALEQRPAPPPPPDLKPLEARVAALENKPAVKPEDPALDAKIASLSAAQKTTQQQAEAAAAAAGESAARAQRLARVQQAEAALRAGKPLGALPDAPPALARFATVAPPTEASLRLSFPQAAKAAAAASQPSTKDLSFAQRMWQRAQTLVTVREGDRVVVGAPASATLAAARARLDAGDLAGAVAALDRLDPAAARAMAPWREQAQALLDARAALAAAAAG